MRSSLDVLRSAKKYVATVLPEFEVRLSSEEGAWERPFCRVAWSTPTLVIPHGARMIECRRTLSVVAWPVEAESPDQARLDAEAITERLLMAFAQGVHAPSYNTATGRAHPFRMPIYDWTGIPITETAPDTARDPRDFADVPEQPSVGDIRDPNADNSRVVTGDFRLRWLRSTAISIEGETVQTVGVQPSP